MTRTEDPGRRLLDTIARLRLETAGRVRTGTDHEAADDVRGTVATDDAIGFDPMPTLAELHRAGVKAVVIGQVAGILHGSIELTGDLDLLWSGDATEAEAISSAFARLDARLANDDGEPIATDVDAFAQPKVTFRTKHTSGDCCTPHLHWGDYDVRAFIERAERCDIEGVAVHYLTLGDLQTMRPRSGAPRDVRRADELDQLHAL